MIPLPSSAAIRLGALVAGVAAAGFGGWVVRGWQEDADRLAAERAAHLTYVKTVEGWAAALQEISGQRSADQQQAADDRRAFDRRLKDATRGRIALATVECPVSDSVARLDAPGGGLQPAPGPVPGVVRLSAAFVGLWNDALAIGLPKAGRTGSGDGARAADGLSAAR